jgi:hypothetical protein
MALERVEISDTKALNPGDRIEMHFKTSGMVWLQATHIALIEYRLSGRKDFEIISNSLPEKNRVIFTIEIKQPPKEEPGLQRASIGLTAGIIAASIIAVGIVAWLTLDKVYQIQESPVGKIAVAGTGVGIAAAGIAAVLLLLLPRK